MSEPKGEAGSAASTVMDDQWPAVTAVVPTHNRFDLMTKAVHAILNQDYPGRIECVVVFDREEPRRPPVEVPDRRDLRLLRNERTPGPAGGYNTGALAAGGDFVALCDDDDEWLPEKLRLQIEAFRRHPEATVGTCGIFVSSGKRTHIRMPPGELVDVDDLLLAPRNAVHSSTLLARREDFVSRIGLIDEEIPGSYGEDLDWLIRGARLGPILSVQRPLVRVRFQYSYFTERWDLVARALPYQLSRVPELHRQPGSLSRMYGRIAFAHAALGHRGEAREWARRSIRLNWRQPRGYMALLVSYGVVRPETLVRLAHTAGRGV